MMREVVNSHQQLKIVGQGHTKNRPTSKNQPLIDSKKETLARTITHNFSICLTTHTQSVKLLKEQNSDTRT
jgi:hypothetical protein